MPSSSTRSTLLERTLLYYLRTVIVRLHSHGQMEAEFDFYISQFSILLDMPVAQLVDKVLPDYVEGTNWNAWKADQNWVRMLKQEANGQDPSVTIGQVAQDLGSVGAALFQVGRDVEARSWCQWAAELEAMRNNTLEEAD
ncbi:hypothetical protein KC318_g828 [Hortaea werneckii]|nr:hypothetical protein KC334_g513 [Hortaea werneckii]KAI7021160.1 hypothetical protein KC355_g2473 [Hortaea werneckii]KAI7675616.1 hypothetical protein KC318_g828 [Hortaea werneckii]